MGTHGAGPCGTAQGRGPAPTCVRPASRPTQHRQHRTRAQPARPLRPPTTRPQSGSRRMHPCALHLLLRTCALYSPPCTLHPLLRTCGTQAPAAISGCGHWRQHTRSRPRPRQASAAASSRRCCAATRRPPASGTPSASATACMSAHTPCRVSAAQWTTAGAGRVWGGVWGLAAAAAAAAAAAGYLPSAGVVTQQVTAQQVAASDQVHPAQQVQACAMPRQRAAHPSPTARPTHLWARSQVPRAAPQQAGLHSALRRGRPAGT